MSDIKMTEDLQSEVLKALSQETSGSVVKSLDESSWLNADIESKLRAKLKEYAHELQAVKESFKER